MIAFVLSANLRRRYLTAGQHAAIVASVTNWATAQKVGNPQFGNLAGLQTVADRATQSGASERTQRMADKVAKADPERRHQLVVPRNTRPRASSWLGDGDVLDAHTKKAPEWATTVGLQLPWVVQPAAEASLHFSLS